MTPLERAQHLNTVLDKSLGKRFARCLFPTLFIESVVIWFLLLLLCSIVAAIGRHFFPDIPWGVVYILLLTPFMTAILSYHTDPKDSGMIARKTLASVGLDPADGAIFLRNFQKNDVPMSAHNTIAGFQYIESLSPKVQAVLLRGPYLYHVR